MSWIQENKFVAGLIGVTAVVGGGILFFGSSQGGAYDEKMEKYEQLKGQYASLEKSKPYPNTANRRAREEGVAKYRNTIEDVRETLDSYRPEELTKLSPEQFNDERVKVTNSLRKAFEEAETTLPENCDFGFERYSSATAKSAATPELKYQLDATEWLLGQLAALKPAAILNINRTTLPVETGAVAPPPTTRKGRPNRNNKAAQDDGEKPYQLMPMELSFTADESAVRDFLKEMVNSKEYYYAIRAVRVRNEKQTAPTEKDANFPAPVGAGPGAAPDPFGGFPGLEDDTTSEGEGEGAATPDDGGAVVPAPAAEVKPGERILKQVLGSEKLHVHIVFDVVLLKPSAEKAEADAQQ
ncbi:hypothetical protein NT6N_09680 [Oceaniferula spumae]|uniref:Uncharacterized protein n=1 Tax=Oceaniferula spumae TaxID=2979115 RepID=A0AAT9FIY5_9BACT